MNEVVQSKVESIRRCIARIEALRPATLEQLVADVDAQDILCLNLERAVQLSVDIATYLLAGLDSAVPDTMSESFRELNKARVIDAVIADKMVKAVGFRNIAIHAYRNIDWAIVFSITRHAPEDFREFVRQVVASESKSG